MEGQSDYVREMLAALRARLELVADVDPAEMTSALTVRETLAFMRMLHRCGLDLFEGE